MPMISGTAKWAKLNKPDTKFTPRWCVDVYVSPATAKELKSAGLNVKKNDEGLYITLSKNVTRKDGSSNEPPVVVDSHKRPFTGNIGNGSLVNVIYKVWEYNAFGRKGVKALLDKVQVVNLVPYAGSEDFPDVDDAGDDNEDF